MAYQDELKSYFNELVSTFKAPLNMSDRQKVFSPLDIINASFIITQKYSEKTYLDRQYSFIGAAIEYTNPNSYTFCSGTGNTYKFLSLPFDLTKGSNIDSFEHDEEGNTIIKVENIATGESTKLLCLDERFNIVRLDENFDISENGNDCLISITNWDEMNQRGEYLISAYYQFTYLIFVQVRDKSQEVTNNG